jgi:hypothetical protein
VSPDSVPALLEVLQNAQESDMVRHEAAEALGGIATPEVFPYLKEYMSREDAPVVVRESCEVALDMYEVGFSSFSPLAPRIECLHILLVVRKFRPIPVRQWIEYYTSDGNSQCLGLRC